jgi:hypothetical protein
MVIGLSSRWECIKEGRFSDAIAVFQRTTELEVCGFTLSSPRLYGLSKLTLEAVQENLLQVASNSWFFDQQKNIKVSHGCLSPGLEPKNDEERSLPQRWEKEIALISAEEFTHALQHLLGKGASRKAAIIETLGNEADVAAFFVENDVTLSREFVQNRYSVREQALRIIRGYQTEADQALLKEQLLATPPDQPLMLGRNVEEPFLGRVGSLSVERLMALKVLLRGMQPEASCAPLNAQLRPRGVEGLKSPRTKGIPRSYLTCSCRMLEATIRDLVARYFLHLEPPST